MASCAFGIRPAAFGADQQRDRVGALRRNFAQQRRRCRLRPGSIGARRSPAGSARTAPRAESPGICTRRDCWLLSRAIRAHRSLRLRDASNRPFSVRVASTGRMRSTPSSVAFSIIHSKRSNLMSAAQSVIRTGSGTAGDRLHHVEDDTLALAPRRSRRGTRAGCRRSRSAVRARRAARASDGALRRREVRRRRCGWSRRRSVVGPRDYCSDWHPAVATIVTDDRLLRGVLLEKHPNQAIVEAGGVGYDVTIPVSTFTQLPGRGRGSAASHPHARARRRAGALRLPHAGREGALRKADLRERHRPDAGGQDSLRPGGAGPDPRHPPRRSGEAGAHSRRRQEDRRAHGAGAARQDARRRPAKSRRLPSRRGALADRTGRAFGAAEPGLRAPAGGGRGAQGQGRRARPREFEPLFRRALELVR